MLIELTTYHDRKVIIRADKIVAIMPISGDPGPDAAITIVDCGSETAYSVFEPFRVVERMWREALKERGVHVELKGVQEHRTGEVARNLGPARSPYPIPENGA